MNNLLHQTVTRSADRDPSRQAFCCGDHSMTYQAWEQRSNQLANLLIERGVQKGDRVGIYLPRSVETAVSVFGIMKAGAAFVPIDPRIPADGVVQLIQDCGIEHLVTHESRGKILGEVHCKANLKTLAGLGAESVPADVVAVSWDEVHQRSSELSGVSISENDLAYIMYSSGSTGRPKGIMHTHYSGMSYARLSVETYDVRPDDRIANHSPLHFDMSTFGYFSSPLASATTVLIPEAHSKVPSSLARLIEKERITIWYSVPLALIQLLLRAPLDSLDMSSIRWVLYGGEPFPPKHLYRLMAKWPDARVSNVYGPAETNQCTYFHVPSLETKTEHELQQLIDEALPIPIGKVWQETEGRVLNADNQPVGIGQTGELVIHSPTMMQGYWQQPERNRRAWYVESTSGSAKNFYRTGDLVQLQEDGNLLFLGRMDRQIKIRGYRVELDDIEHALAGLTAVEEAAVFAVRQPDETKTVEAAVILRPDQQADSQTLLACLAKTLSPYSVPTRLDIVGEFPRTNSGKIDRRQLQQTAEARHTNEIR